MRDNVFQLTVALFSFNYMLKWKRVNQRKSQASMMNNNIIMGLNNYWWRALVELKKNDCYAKFHHPATETEYKTLTFNSKKIYLTIKF